MTPIKAIVMSDGTNIPFQNFHDIAQEIGGFDTSFEDENFLDHTNNEDVGMMLKNVNGGLISTNILNKELPQPNPIITLLDKAKLEETSIDIRIEDIKIPKKALYHTILDSFGEESIDNITDFIMMSIDIKEIKKSLRKAIHNIYNTESSK
jgi:hypothetical protein